METFHSSSNEIAPLRSLCRALVNARPVCIGIDDVAIGTGKYFEFLGW